MALIFSGAQVKVGFSIEIFVASLGSTECEIIVVSSSDEGFGCPIFLVEFTPRCFQFLSITIGQFM